MQLRKACPEMAFILQLFMQETDELIAAIKETLTQKNVRHTTILNILQ